MGRRKTTKLAASWQDADAERPGEVALRLVAAVGIALLTVSLSAAYAARGRNGRLLLLTCDAVPPAGKGASHLRTMRPDGSGFRTILKLDATYSDNCSIDQATWSPNGRTVLYSTFRGIWTIRADGKRKQSLLDVGSYAAWSPNGREVVFVQRVEESQADALFRVRRDGNGLRRITPPVESEIYGPSWSPDGRTIAFTVWDNGQESVWTVGANGSRLHKIAEKARLPDWSPDGRRIIFTDRLSVLTMARDGSRRRRITPPVLEDETFQATYSPDGSKIAFVRDWRVWVMTAKGKRAHIVSPVDTLVFRVDWQRR
jgi:Tol biopolymer transport system component